jgi:hypothetical protein
VSEARERIGFTLGKAIACGLAYAVGLILAGMVSAQLRLPQPAFPPVAVSPGRMFLEFVAVSALLGLCLLPLAIGIVGKPRVRGIVIAALIFVCLGLTSVMEIQIFTTMLAHGGAATLLLGAGTGAVLSGLGFALLFRGAAYGEGAQGTLGEFLRKRSLASWSWRFVAAWLAFPAAYFLFGMIVAPLVIEAYRDGNLGLVLPPMSAILRTVLLRSALFLAVSFPFVVLWRKSRGGLILALGLAHWMLVGLFGLLPNSWFPAVLRIAHSLEIGADSFAYAAALVLLLRPRD